MMLLVRVLFLCSGLVCDGDCSQKSELWLTARAISFLIDLIANGIVLASNNGERLVRRTEFHSGGRTSTSKMIGRRKAVAGAVEVEVWFGKSLVSSQMHDSALWKSGLINA